MASPPDAFRMFFVCTGNQARSPIAAAWTARAVEGLPVEVGSAGTLPRPPSPVLLEAGAIATQLGLDLALHRSSHVAEHDLASVDLVLGFELNHVASAVVDGRAEASRAFLLKELVRLARDAAPPAQADPVERARAIVRQADALRRERGHSLGEEIRDPAGRRVRVFREIASDVVRACDEMVALLFGP
ncbi:MAG TPA: hypothetical protein VHN37_11510 [Actinomycetota bacterium]|nr:hypothetical protein [Actinomycetota bacterium]